MPGFSEEEILNVIRCGDARQFPLSDGVMVSREVPPSLALAVAERLLGVPVREAESVPRRGITVYRPVLPRGVDTRPDTW